MLPRHKFASPVVMFTKSKFKYMSCGGQQQGGQSPASGFVAGRDSLSHSQDWP